MSYYLSDDELARREQTIDECMPIAAELVHAVRDLGPDEVRAVIEAIPAEGVNTVLVLLAAMVDPEQTTTTLLGWVDRKPKPGQDESFRVRNLGRAGFGHGPLGKAERRQSRMDTQAEYARRNRATQEAQTA